ncbi:hypothetical protein SteCoe_25752 [Stentor coeruleus]|uniref:Uncharacterized protein n=1 Tax=Stentor coeruleus TaxID=5963 RepID=A0A1R2BEG1_9CILI|nr:hypothetical protein SteCoe_25752 [Stentor coeruleus]
MESPEQKRPLPRPHSPPKILETHSDNEVTEDYQARESPPLQLRNLTDNSNRSNNQNSYKLSTHKCRQETTSNSLHRSSSLEHRLHGATSAVKHLENEIKQKKNLIASLQEELNEKTKLLDSYSSQITSAQTHQKSSQLQSSITSIIRKKEKELEKIIKSQQAKIEEDKKTMFRLQELNKTLVTKVKDQEKKLEELEFDTAEKLQKYHANRNLIEENEHLAVLSRRAKQDADGFKQELRVWQEKYQNLLNSSMDFEFQTRELYKANQILNENIIKLLENSAI